MLSGLFASEQVRLRCLLLDLRIGLPRSMMEVSDAFLLWEFNGSVRSTLGEARRSTALEGDVVLLNAADIGVGSAVFGDRRISTALTGVPAESEDGVISWVLLGRLLSGGFGDPLLSIEGDFGGTSGGSSRASAKLAPVSTFNAGLALPGLRMGESGLPNRLVNSGFGSSRAGEAATAMAAWSGFK